MTMTGSSTGSSADYSSTETGQDSSRIVGNGNVEKYDILTFFAQFLSFLGYAPSAIEQSYLLMIFLDDLAYQVPRDSGSGGTSRVVVMKSEAIIERGIYRAQKPILPETIAIKMTKPSARQGGTVVDGALLRSMATELRILSEDTIRSHGNIISLLDVTLGIQLNLCLGIARGVACLHEAGAVHCDIKPQNVVVFRQDDPESPFVPKIIDFNIAVLSQDVPDRVPLPAGTGPWDSPEQMMSTFISKVDLPKVDIYSLGMLMLNILTVDCLRMILEYIAARGVCGVSLLEFKRSSALALNAVNFLEQFGLAMLDAGQPSRL
ncbi:hypothetical protein VTI74DRAFT_3132 [Chaetomium olivicolor]